MPRSPILIPPLVLLAAGTAWALSSFPPSRHTGAPATGGQPAEATCARSTCHTGNPVNGPGGELEILGLPETYAPGQTYDLTLRFASSATAGNAGRRWGFELTCFRTSDGMGRDAAGDLVPGPGTATTRTSLREYLAHGPAKTGDASPVEWTFQWTAPAGDEGTILFAFTGNAANGNGTSAGDFIYTAVDSVPGPPTPVEATTWGTLKTRPW
jgi:hypothetical protein